MPENTEMTNHFLLARKLKSKSNFFHIFSQAKQVRKIQINFYKKKTTNQQKHKTL